MSEYRTIDINAWTKVGEGGNGSVYVDSSEPDAILKVNRPGLNTEAFVRHEFEVSKAVEGLGLPIPRMLEMVRVGDGFGTLSERIRKKKSLSRLCADAPERTEEMAQVLCEQFKTLSTTPCNTDFFPNRKEQLLRAVDKVRFIGKKNRGILRAFALTVPEVTTCSHGDLNMGNLVSSEGHYLWIDLDPGLGFQLFHHGDRAGSGTAEDALQRGDVRFACLDLVLRCEFVPPRLAEELFFCVMIRRSIKNYYL